LIESVSSWVALEEVAERLIVFFKLRFALSVQIEEFPVFDFLEDSFFVILALVTIALVV
jgi:hypothetical protein